MQKNRKILDLVIKIMRFTTYQLLLITLTFTIANANNSNAQEILNRRISLTLENVKLKKAISEIENIANVNFAYSSKKISVNQKISITVDNETLKNVCERLFTPLQINFNVYNENNIVLTNEKSFGNIEKVQAINGTVSDESGEGLIGATILIKGTSSGTTTDFEGRFSLEASPGDILIISYTGYTSQEITVGTQSSYDIVLLTGAYGLEEIVVSARKRDENLQEVPIAITALQGKELTTRDISDISQVGNLAPNVTLRPTASLSGSSNASAFFIRGVGQTDFAVTTDPGVGTYIDGVYVARSVGGLLETLDLESLEVLRGPQGTLFGRNTIGGALNVTTKRPGDFKTGQIRLTVGNFGRLDVAGAFNTPITPKLKLRFSGMSQNRDGFVTRLITDPQFQTSSNIVGDKQGNKNSDVFRGSLLYDPSEKFEIRLNVDYSKIREQSAASTAAISSIGVVPASPIAPIDIPGIGLVSPGDPLFISDNIDETYATGPNETSLDVYGISATAKLDLGEIELKSISAWRSTEGTFNRDGDGTPFAIGEQTRDIEFTQFSQEIQLSNAKQGSNLKWTTGAYFFTEEATDVVNISLENLLPPPGIDIDNLVENTSIAIFGQGSYSFTDKLSGTLGLRWTQDDKTYTTTQILSGIPVTVVDGTGNEVFSAITGRAGLEYKWKKNMISYVSASRGFKSGGFTPRYVNPAEAPLSFDPETVVSFEVGTKIQNADNTLRLNIAAFNSIYDDIQLVLFDEFGAPVNLNGGEANINGIEIEGKYVPSKIFDISGSFGYTNASFTSVLPTNDVAAFQPITLDSEFPNTPNYTLTLSPSLTIPTANGNNFNLKADWFFSGDVHQTFENDPELFQEAYNLLGGSLSYNSTKQNWSISVGVRNLTDERVIISGGIGRAPGFGDRNFNAPRMWNTTFNINF